MGWGCPGHGDPGARVEGGTAARRPPRWRACRPVRTRGSGVTGARARPPRRSAARHRVRRDATGHGPERRRCPPRSPWQPVAGSPPPRAAPARSACSPGSPRRTARGCGIPPRPRRVRGGRRERTSCCRSRRLRGFAVGPNVLRGAESDVGGACEMALVPPGAGDFPWAFGDRQRISGQCVRSSARGARSAVIVTRPSSPSLRHRRAAMVQRSGRRFCRPQFARL